MLEVNYNNGPTMVIIIGQLDRLLLDKIGKFIDENFILKYKHHQRLIYYNLSQDIT